MKHPLYFMLALLVFGCSQEKTPLEEEATELYRKVDNAYLHGKADAASKALWELVNFCESASLEEKKSIPFSFDYVLWDSYARLAMLAEARGHDHVADVLLDRSVIYYVKNEYREGTSFSSIEDPIKEIRYMINILDYVNNPAWRKELSYHVPVAALERYEQENGEPIGAINSEAGASPR